MPDEPDPPPAGLDLEAHPTRVAFTLVTALDGAGLKPAIGGSIALGLWGVPRGTKDADLNVFCEPAEHPRLLDVLIGAGCTPAPEALPWSSADRDLFLRRCAEGDVAVVYLAGTRVDVFVPSIDFYREAERTLAQVALPDGRTVPALSAEALCVFKLLFFRDKDLVDLRRLVARRGSALDHRYVQAQLEAMFPGGDERLDVWAKLVAEHGGA